MRQAAETREAARIERFSNFHAHPADSWIKQPYDRTPKDQLDYSLIERYQEPRREADDRSVEGHEAKQNRLNREIAELQEQISTIDQQASDLEDERRDANAALEQAQEGRRTLKKSLSKVHAERDARGRIAKWLNPNAGQEAIDAIEAELARADARCDKWSQRSEDLRQEREELRQRRADVNEKIERKEYALVRLDAEERSADVFALLQQQLARGRRAPSVQETWEMPQEQSNDSGMEL